MKHIVAPIYISIQIPLPPSDIKGESPTHFQIWAAVQTWLTGSTGFSYIPLPIIILKWHVVHVLTKKKTYLDSRNPSISKMMSSNMVHDKANVMEKTNRTTEWWTCKKIKRDYVNVNCQFRFSSIRSTKKTFTSNIIK